MMQSRNGSRENRAQEIPPLVCLDFEASCLPSRDRHSYPVEVGIAFPDGNDTRSWPIRPTDEWLRDRVRDVNSERMHGLDLDRLHREGESVALVRRELAAAVRGFLVVSDNPWYEATWANILYDGPPPFQVMNYETVLYERVGLPALAFRDALQDAAEAAFRRVPQRHRAGPDALRLAEICRALLCWSRET